MLSPRCINNNNITLFQIINTLKNNSSKANSLINEIAKEKSLICDKKVKEMSKKSIITDFSNIKSSTKKKLKYIS